MTKFTLTAGRAYAFKSAATAHKLPAALKAKLDKQMPTGKPATIELDKAQALAVAKAVALTLTAQDWRKVLTSPQSRGAGRKALATLAEAHKLKPTDYIPVDPKPEPKPAN